MLQIRVTKIDAMRTAKELAQMALDELGAMEKRRVGKSFVGTPGWAANHAIAEYKNATREERLAFVRAWIAEDSKRSSSRP
jgi:hypothetical protein